MTLGHANCDLHDADVAESVARMLDKRIGAGDLDMPMLPAAATKLLALPEDADARALCGALETDQVIAAHVLRLANSAAYRGATEIVSLSQAVARLGGRVIRQLVMLIVSDTQVFHSVRFAEPVRLARERSVAAAVFSGETARQKRLSVEHSFLGGLLHNVGQPILWRLLEQHVKGEASQSTLEDIVIKRHSVVGATLAAAWELPATLIDLLNNVEDSPQPAEEVDDFVWVVRFGCACATQITNAGESTNDNDVPHELQDHPSVDWLELYPDDVEHIWAHRDRALALLSSKET